MQLFVKGNGSPFSLTVAGSDTIEDVKMKVAKVAGISAAEQQLIYDGRVLDDLCTIGDYSVQADSTLTLAVPLAGGKVHGSLARAGKVRGQTPKVAKQTDKPKRVRGRAKRRLQYNRRFKNIVVGAGGKKKGPNTQAIK